MMKCEGDPIVPKAKVDADIVRFVEPRGGEEIANFPEDQLLAQIQPSQYRPKLRDQSREFRYQRMEQSSSQSFGALVRRYMHEAMPERYSTKKSYVSILKRHILPQWGEAPVAEVKKPLKVEQWLKELKHSPKTKSNIKGLPASHL
jgi:hypothetical protein